MSDVKLISESSSDAIETDDDVETPARKRRKISQVGRKVGRRPKKLVITKILDGKSKHVDTQKTNSESESGSEIKLTEPTKKSNRVLNRPEKKTQSVRKPKGLDQNLAPLHDIKEIFLHLTERALELGLEKAIQHLGSRRLRVATMCSGTESPLLSMKLIARSLESLGQSTLQFEHLFSAEIVPYKQAYIERNFQPAIIFRDITEMTSKNSRNSEATTAYGGKVPIPGEVDILIAGAACVDFSLLNSNKKNIQEVGESGDTFRAVLQYCKIWRPRIAILENVSGAPWDAELKPQFEKEGFEVSWVAVDTKDYYLPQTRERGYMICVDRSNISSSSPSLTRKWAEAMFAFERRASSSVSGFLLPDDDPRIQQGRAASINFDDVREWDWIRCQARHSKVRQELRLGFKRPLTNWDAGVATQIPDYADRNYILKQVERVWDTLDCSLLRKALPTTTHDGYDCEFKTRVWELSQNVDRATDNHAFGIAPCITPTGNPYITDRGGPLTGIEALAMQGLPINDLTFTHETQKNLQDLAGNAMSSTVVGSAILSALLAAYVVLPLNEKHSAQIPQEGTKQPDNQLDFASSKRLELEHQHSSKFALDLDSFLADAARSCRRCYCEGRSKIAESPIQICKLCAHTTCLRCGGYPRHDYIPRSVSSRMMPKDFEERWRAAFPLLIRVRGLTGKDFLDAAERLNSKMDKAICSEFVTAVDGAVQQDIRFEQLGRASAWTVSYASPKARLQLFIRDKRVEWQLFAKPPSQLAANSILRSVLERPIARGKPKSQDLMDCCWEIYVPCRESFKVSVLGEGEKTDSWRARLGLVDFKPEKVWRTLNIQVPEAIVGYEDLSGTYELLPECGTASGSLHVRTGGLPDEEPVFLFLDPTRIGDPAEDAFVFSRDVRRLQYGETRTTMARLDPKWRPWSSLSKSSVQCITDGRWVTGEANNVQLEIVDLGLALRTTPPSSRDIGRVTDMFPLLQDCFDVTVLSSCDFQAPEDLQRRRGGHDWESIDLSDTGFYKSFAWLLQKVCYITGFDQWRRLDSQQFSTSCLSCAPKPPPLRWNSRKDLFIPYEDARMAQRFEHTLKNRSNVFAIRLCLPEASAATMEIGLNVHSLAHRAVSKIDQDRIDMSGKLLVDWNFCTTYSPPPRMQLKPFRLFNNRADPELGTLPGFRLELRHDQKRSLSWMRKQEAADLEPFMLEEIEEVFLPQLKWKAEARARREITVRGGVLADEPGYGKTITSLALIHTGFSEAGNEKTTQHIETPADCGLISVEATLVVCPKHLVEQWCSEIERCLGKSYRDLVIKIKTMQDLAKFSIQSFQVARIIVLSWDLLESSAYLSKLAFFAAIPNGPTKPGRPFQVWLKYALQRFPDHVDYLRKSSSGVPGLQNELKQKLAALASDEEFKRSVPSKRLRGSAYAKKKANKIDFEESQSDSEEAEDFDRFISSNALRCGKGKGWTSLECPLVHIFRFNRVIVDEFALLEGKNHAIISAIASDKTWVLSGTPPLHSFTDIDTIASFLKIKLTTDAAPMSSRKDTYTAAEQFHAFREAHSPAWHEHRQAYAQSFLDRFVRHNIPEIDEIQSVQLIKASELLPDDRALYAELNAFVMTQDMRLKKGKKKTLSEIDREKRIMQALGGSQSPEEALIKRAVASEGQGLDAVLQNRQRQHESLVEMLGAKLKQAESLRGQLDAAAGEYYDIWKGEVANGFYGDPDAERVLVETIVTEGGGALDSNGKLKLKSHGQAKNKKSSTKSGSGRLQLQDVTVALRKMSLELVTQARSLRLIQNLSEPEAACNGEDCPQPKVALSQLHVSSNCGHFICDHCLHQQLVDGKCAVRGCHVRLQSSDVYQAESLISRKDDKQKRSKDKLEDVVELLQQIKEYDEQALLFVQFDSLVAVVEAALRESGITFDTMDDNDAESSNTLKKFQTETGPSKKQVLILNCASESAAGANLFNANHLIFLSPLLVTNQQKYEAAMKQAIGRAVRYGQTRKVHIYRFVTLSTIDVDIMQHRERRSDALYDDGNVVKKHEREDEDGDALMGGVDSSVEETKEKIKIIKACGGRVRFAPLSWGLGDGDVKQEFGTGVSTVSRYFLDG